MSVRGLVLMAVLLVAGAAAGWFVPALDRPLEPHLVAQDLMREGRAREAAYLFDDPVWQGVAEYRAGRLYRAAGAFVQTRSALSLYNLGTAYARVKQWPGAVAAYEAVLRLEPDHADAQHNLALVRRARAAEQRQIEESRNEKRAGIWQDGMLKQRDGGDPAANMPVRQDGNSAGGGETAPSERPGSESASGGSRSTPGDVAPEGRARAGAAEAGDRPHEAPEGLTGASAARSRRAESAQQAEQILRRIVDHPEQVLAARLRNAQKLRERPE